MRQLWGLRWEQQSPQADTWGSPPCQCPDENKLFIRSQYWRL